MANSDYTIADQTGASFLTDINGQLEAIQTNNSKDTAPVALDGVAVGMLWYNSATMNQSGIPAGTVGVCTAVSGGAGTWTPVQTTVDDSLASTSSTVALSSNGGKTLKDVQDIAVSKLALLPGSISAENGGSAFTPSSVTFVRSGTTGDFHFNYHNYSVRSSLWDLILVQMKWLMSFSMVNE